MRIGDVTCDLNTAFASDFGQWRTVGGRGPAATAPPFPFPATHYLATARDDPRCHSQGEAVARWQRKMAQRGWRIPTSGRFDARCDQVCRRFQAEKALVVDGKVGPVTWRATWTAPVTLGEPWRPDEPEEPAEPGEGEEPEERELPDGSDEFRWDGDDDRPPLL